MGKPYSGIQVKSILAEGKTEIELTKGLSPMRLSFSISHLTIPSGHLFHLSYTFTYLPAPRALGQVYHNFGKDLVPEAGLERSWGTQWK